MTQAKRNWKSWAVTGGKLLLVLLVAWYVRKEVGKAWNQLVHGEANVSFDPFWAVMAMGGYGASLLVAGSYWRWLLCDLGAEISWVRALRAYIAGHLGKYVPGKALVVVIRSSLAAGPKVDAAVAAVTVFVETLTMMASGAALAFVVLLATGANWKWLAFAGALLCITGGPTIPRVFRLVLRLVGVTRKWPEAAAQLHQLHARVLVAGWCCMVVAWVLQGCSLWATFMCLGFDGVSLSENLPLLTAAAAISIVAGFVAFLPGGLGVREAVLLEILEGVNLVQGAALLATVGSRLVMVAAELVLAAAFYPFARKPPAAEPPPSREQEFRDSGPDSPEKASASVVAGV